jgi:hypothetical protein
MSLNKWISLLALLCFCGSLVFLLQARRDKNQSAGSAALSQSSDTATGASSSKAEAEIDPRLTPLSDGRVLLNSSAALGEELGNENPERDLEIVAQLLEQYRLVFGENPMGSENEEIVAQLLGKNSQKLVFIQPESPHLSSTGELLDRWDSPFVFHPLAASAMEILSLGPDQTLWTEDDLIFELEEFQSELQL